MAHQAGKAAKVSMVQRVFVNAFAGVGVLTTLAGAYFSFKTMRYSQTQREEVQHRNLENLRETTQHFHDTFRPNQDDAALFASDSKEAYLDYLRVCQEEFASKTLARNNFMSRFITESAIIPPVSPFLAQHPPPGADDLPPSASSDAPVWTPGTSVFERKSDGALIAVDTVYKLRDTPGSDTAIVRDANGTYVDSLTKPLDSDGKPLDNGAASGKDVHDVYGLVAGTGSQVWVPVQVQVETLRRTGDVVVTMDTDLPHGVSFRQFRPL